MLSYSIVVFHLSFNFLSLLLLYSIYLCVLDLLYVQDDLDPIAPGHGEGRQLGQGDNW
jgi:hypothetical protein